MNKISLSGLDGWECQTRKQVSAKEHCIGTIADDRRKEFVVSVGMPVQIRGEETGRQAFVLHIFRVAV